MKTISKIISMLIIVLCLYTSNVQAQMLGPNAYFKTSFMEIGINGLGGQEGCPTPMPPGMHHRSGNPIMGFVTNPQMNAWLVYDGDFFTPGSPESGWGLSIGTTQHYNNNDVMMGTPGIPGSIKSWSRNGSCLTSTWSGTLTSGGHNIGVQIIYDVEDGKLHYNTTVLLTNNSATVIPDMYYTRTLDPDNNVMMAGGSFSTVNEIEDVAASNSCSLSCISAATGTLSASGVPPTLGPPTYMALAAVGSEYRVTSGSFSNRRASEVWTGVGAVFPPYNQTLGFKINCDCAIALAARVQTLAPGATATIKFVTILNKADKGIAVQSLMKLSFPGSVLNPKTACAPPDTIPACNGVVPISITGPLLSSYTFSWSPAIGLSTTTGPSVLCSVAVPTTYTCFGTPISACAAPIQFRFVVVPSIGPALTSTITSNSPICSGITTSLSVTAPSPLTYYWMGPSSYTSAIQSPTISFATLAPGIYTSVVTTTAYCSITNTVDVRLGITPTITIGSNSPVCEGSPINLNSSGAVTYTWSGPAGFSSTLQNPSIFTSSVPDSGTYTLNVMGTECPNTATISVVVIPFAPVTIAPVPIVCNNSTLTLLASNGGTLYSWTGPNSFTSSIQNPVITPAKIKHAGLYRVTSVSIFGCVSSASVIVNVYDSLRLTNISKNLTLCAGKTGTLSTTGGTGGSGHYDFNWSPPIYLDSPYLSVTGTTATATTDYTLTLSDSYCPMTTSRTLTVSVKVNPIPVITYSTSNNRGCEPFITNFKSTSEPASASCYWLFNNELSSFNCEETAFEFSTPGKYDMKLVVLDINGCTDSVKEPSFIIVDPKPFVNFDYSPLNPNIYNNNIDFLDNSSIGLPMQKWHWIFGDGFVDLKSDTSNKSKCSHLYENTGLYHVSLEVTNVFGCKNIKTKNIKIEDDFSLFMPNSFTPGNKDGINDRFIPVGTGFFKESFEMIIFDRWGATIYKTNDITKGWDGTCKGVLVKDGIYVYKIKVRDYKNRPQEFTGHITIF
jgi:gliding motility-associated-like protein